MAYTILALVLLTSGYVVYMTALHPLAKYPGPFLAKLTNLYSFWYGCRGTRHYEMHRMHEKYGKVVRWGPNKLSFTDARAVQQIYGATANVVKDTFYDSFTPAMFSTTDKEVHARKKRIMQHAFTDQAMRECQPYVLSAISAWCTALGDVFTTAPSEWSLPKDMAEWSAYPIFDAFGEVLFGESFRTATSTDNRFFVDAVAQVIFFRGLVGQLPFLNSLGLDGIFLRGKAKARQNLVAHQVGLVKKRLAQGDKGGRRDIIHYLSQGNDPKTGQGYTPPELIGEAINLMGAGLDTANTTLNSIFYFLTQNPAVLDRLTKSIREVYASEDEIQYDVRLQANLYLRACIDECMRLCPPAIGMLPRRVCAGGQTILGQHLPENTVVGISPYALHHCADYFDRPYVYDPSRWLAKGSSADADEGVESDVLSHQRQAYMPFSVGPRSCIGKNLALMELHVSVARVLYMYDIRMAAGSESMGVGPHGEYATKEYFLVGGKKGPVLQFRRVIKTTADLVQAATA